jgi:putative isomerase
MTGVIDIGEKEMANTIMQAFCTMCVEHGFYENFDAKTGAGNVDPAYIWTSSVFMIFANQLVK